MASPNSSSSSSPSPSPYPSESQPGSRPVTQNGGGHAQHASPYTLRPRSVSVAISDRSEAEFDDELLQSQLAQTVEYDDAQQWPLREDDRADGRRRVESDSSDYQPSDSDQSPGPGEPEIKEEEDGSVRMSGIEARPGSNFEGRDHGTPSSASRNGHKRSRERTFSTPFVDDNEPQSKRRSYAKAGINMHYLELLEDDMDDARRRYIPEDRPELMTTQIGLTLWTTEEKEMFHEAVGRLGSDDIQGIAARLLGSKSEVEVRHYMHVLKENAETRRRDLRTPLHKPLLSEFPAATEISEACCTALEKTADIISKREDIQEARDEQRKWGPHWLLTGDNCRDLSKAALEMTGMSDEDGASNQSPMPTGGPQAERLAELASELRSEAVPALALFDVRTMLLLSERVFMNGRDEDANYMGLGEALPAIQMSALNDMCALVYTVTQRLAATAMHMCRSRDQAKRHLPHSVKKLVRSRDVHAAVASLGLKKDSRAFWARCPRRLGLNVSRSALPFADMDGIGIRSESVDNDDPDDQGEDESDESDHDDSEEDGPEDSSSDDESDIFSTYGEVEEELLPGGDEHGIDQPTNGQDQDEEQSEDGSEYESDEESESANDSDASDSDEGNERNKKQVDKVTEQRVNDEAEEVINYTASNFPATSWAETSLKNRIRDELKEEEYACAVDSHASKRDELYLWAVLGRKPPSKLGLNKFDENETPQVEGFSVDARRFPVDEVIETGNNWRDRLQYEAEWEASAIEAQKMAKEEKEQEKGDHV